MSRALLRLKHASLGYGGRSVLTGVELEVEAGAFVGILGQNGSGKTTLLKTILGLIPCLKGQISFHGTKGPPRLGYVPQKEKLDPIYPLSVYDVAAMGTYRRLEIFRGLRGAGPRALVERCLADCGAVHLAGKRYSDLSEGQKQRALIARALAAEPEILALDEPLAGIDITTHKALLKLLKQLHESRGLTVLMVSHRIQAEKDLFTHIAWLDEGKVAMGSAAEMLASGRVSEVFKSEI